MKIANLESRVPVSSAAKKVTSNANANKKLRRNLRWTLRNNVDATFQWIRDSASSRLLVTMPSLLYDMEECMKSAYFQIKKLKNVAQRKWRFCGTFRWKASSHQATRCLSLGNLPWNILSYGKSEEIGYDFRFDGITRAVVRRKEVFKIFDVEKEKNNVLVVCVVIDDVVGIDPKKIEECVGAALIEAASLTISDSQQGSLLDFHLWFGHLAYDTIDKVAKTRQMGYFSRIR